MVSSLSPKALRLFSFWKARPPSKQGRHYLGRWWAGQRTQVWKTMERMWWILRLAVLIALYVFWDRPFHCSVTTRSAHGANYIRLCVILFEHMSPQPCFANSTVPSSGRTLAQSLKSLDPVCAWWPVQITLLLRLVFLLYKPRTIFSLS